MSKKKSSGSTMTLKDFHGGSIPSDLPLPSAPGVVPRPATDRPGYDRAPWGASMGRLDQRARPSSSPSIRGFDDKAPFLPHTANIGRNFSEDERKPLDGHSAPRRMVSDNIFRAPITQVEAKPDTVLAGRLMGWQGPGGSWPVKKIDAAHSETGSHTVGGNNENAWASRRAVTPPSNEPGQSSWTTQIAVSKLVHGSAIDQVSSGRWHSKLVDPGQVENVKHSEVETGLYKHNADVPIQREPSDEMIAKHMEKGMSIEDGTLDGKNPRNAEAVERPKLKLLPRTKPLQNIEKPLNEAKQESASSMAIQRESVNLKLGSSTDESGIIQQADRPKLNLKPLSQLLVQPDLNPERERNGVFGGARPRELVLKERGIDETDHHELEQQLERVKPSVPKMERVAEQANAVREIRSGKFEKRDGRGVIKGDRSETERRNWRNNSNERKPQGGGIIHEKRHPSPETWRKPEETQKPEAAGGGRGHGYGKAASALELAQAFSKPFSAPSAGKSSFDKQRSLGRNQVPFSRLIASTPATSSAPRQINGY